MIVRLRQNHMATTFEFVINCEPDRVRVAEQVLEKAHRRVAVLERELSEFLPESPVFALNHAPPGLQIQLPETTAKLLTTSLEIADQTGGAFDPLAKSAPGLVRMDGLNWNPQTRIASRADGAWLGFGAIGKGFALDQIRPLIELEGFTDYFLSAGGSSIICSGFAAPGESWKWGWSWSKDLSGTSLGIPFAHPRGEPIAIGISGTHEKGNHLLGRKAVVPYQSALVALGSATHADAYSTALFVDGWEKGKPKLETASSSPATAVIDSKGVPLWNGVFERLWGAPVKTAASFLFAALVSSLSFVSSLSWADEELDLGAWAEEGAEAFNPYLYEREIEWLALPVLILLLLALHLKRTKRVRRPGVERRLVLPLVPGSSGKSADSDSYWQNQKRGDE